MPARPTSPPGDSASARSVRARLDTAADDVEALLVATFRVIERSGDPDPSVRDILREAKLSTPVFYRHFRSKDELMLLVHDRGVRILADYLRRRIDRVAGWFDKVEAYIDGILRQATARAADGTRPFVLASRELRAAFPDERRDQDAMMVAPLAEVIEAGVHAGEFVSPDPWSDALIIRDCTIAALTRYLLDQTPPDNAEKARLVDFARRALTSPP